MTAENIATCKAILATLTAEPLPGATAGLAVDGALEVTFNDVSFALRRGEWVGNAVSITCRLRDFQVERASAVHKEITRIGGMMAIAADKPNPAHLADLFKIGNALGGVATMTPDAIAAAATRRRKQSESAVEFNHRLLEIRYALGVSPTSEHEDVLAFITRLRATDPLGALGAPEAYSNGEPLTMKERLLYLLARLPE